MPRLLTETEISSRLKKLRGWRHRGRFITKTFRFETFADAMRFVNRVAEVAEAQEHHPDIRLRYNVVRLSIQTHSEGGITSWDLGLARAVDRATSR